MHHLLIVLVELKQINIEFNRTNMNNIWINCSIIYKVTRKIQTNRTTSLDCSELANKIQDPFQSGNFGKANHGERHLVELHFIVDRDDESAPFEPKASFTKYYLIELLQDTNRPTQSTVLSFREINPLVGLFDGVRYLDNYAIVKMPSTQRNPAWTDALMTIIENTLEASDWIVETLSCFKYGHAEFHESILDRLTANLKDQERAKSVLNDLRRLLSLGLPRTQRWSRISDHEDEDYYTDYSNDELEDMYRAAYENDPCAVWNND